MLELFFQVPFTLRRFRSGIIGPHLDAFAAHLANRGHSQQSACAHLRAAAHLGVWLEGQALSLSSIDENTLLSFRAHLNHCCCPRPRRGMRELESRGAGASLLLAWLRAEGVVSTRAPATEMPELIVRFETWMVEHRGVRPFSLYANYRLDLRRFLETLGEQPERYEPARIRGFIMARAKNYSRACAKRCANAVRGFLRYLVARGRCPARLIDAVPTLAYWKKAHLPVRLSTEQVQRLISACDLSTPAGQRDRAMLLLLARLGLRAGDVAKLKLDDIDWDESILRVSGKGRRQVRLPLPQDVGDAILRYLAEGRPNRDEAYVFLGLLAPFRPITSTVVSQRASQIARYAGVLPARSGAHILRHTLASSLLNNGMSLPAISALLRHSTLETTEIYAKVDQSLLSAVVQPWPMEVSS